MPHETIDIIERILSAYASLTTAERKLADFVLENSAKVQFMSITQLAEECGVAEATVSRFCRTLELKGFNAFKLELARRSASAPAVQELPPESAEGRRAAVGATAEAAVQQTLSLLSPEAVDRAVTLFEKAHRVVCLGSGGSMLLAQVFAHLFSTVAGNFWPVSDSHNQLSTVATMGPEDVVVLFSYSGATTIGLQILELAKSRGIPTVLVTRFVKSPAAALSDVVLCCGANEGPFQLGSVAAKVAQLVVSDVLYQEYCHRNRQRCDEYIQNIAAALSESHV